MREHRPSATVPNHSIAWELVSVDEFIAKHEPILMLIEVNGPSNQKLLKTQIPKGKVGSISCVLVALADIK